MPFIAIILGLLALGGTAVMNDVSPESKPSGISLASAKIADAVRSFDSSTETEGTIVDSAISQDQAIVIAQARFAGTVGRVEQEMEDGILVWNIRITNTDGVRADISVNAGTGEIVRFKSENVDTKENDENENEDGDHASTVTEVTKDEAIAIAKGKLDGDVIKTQLEGEDGVQVWNVRIVNTTTSQRADVRINATTGDVIRLRIRDMQGNSLSSVKHLSGDQKGNDNESDDVADDHGSDSGKSAEAKTESRGEQHGGRSGSSGRGGND